MEQKMNQRYFDAKFETLSVMIKNVDEKLETMNERTDANEKDIHALQIDNVQWRMHRNRLEANVKIIRWAVISLGITLVGTLAFIIAMK